MIWKRSKLRFYFLNALWNYKFWLFAEKVFKEHTYEVDEDFDLNSVDVTGKMFRNKSKVSRRRFIGYMYKNKMYLDNPGLKESIDKDTWAAWRNKGLIK